ncbi:MAG: LysE family translocator [Paracoccaceae bacterium]
MICGEYFVILIGWAVAGGSPGPATLAISGTSMNLGRGAGLAIAAGVVCGSASWGIAAALGMSALMLANGWVFEVIRYVGAAYLLFLAAKSLKQALSKTPDVAPARVPSSRLFMKGLLLHLTNPKAILSWGAIYAIALPEGAGMADIWALFALLISTSMFVFFGYAMMFSSAAIAQGYRRMQRWFHLGFAALFGVASIKILTAKLEV